MKEYPEILDRLGELVYAHAGIKKKVPVEAEDGKKG